MHRELRDLLHDATGESKKVVAIFLDVRGFTTFAGLAESTDAADFLKSAYSEMLDRYFADAAYFKPTGDGLMVIYEFNDPATLQAQLREAVVKAVGLVEELPEITKNDPMINFEVPANLGIGIARGSATVLVSGEKVLDYTGRPLNLAARLMDLARPSGVVLAANIGVDLLEQEVQGRFEPDFAYVNGIAEESPLSVYVLAGVTTIPDHRRVPIVAPVRVTEMTEKSTLERLSERGPRFETLLTREPAKDDDIKVFVTYPKARSDGTRHPTISTTGTYSAKLSRKMHNAYAQIDYLAITKQLQAQGCKPKWSVAVTIEYSARSTASPS